MATTTTQENKKISELTQATPTLASLFPFVKQGQNYSASLEQILSLQKKPLLTFSYVRSNSSAVVGTGSATETLPIVYDTIRKRFYAEREADGNYAYYTAWDGSDQFFDDSGAIRADAAFACADGTLWMWSGSELAQFGGPTETTITNLLDAVNEKITLLTPIPLTEAQVDAMNTAKTAVEGQVYVTFEEE